MGNGSATTLAGIFDQQDAGDQSQTGTQPSLISDFGTTSLSQSANSTGSVVDGLQSLLDRLAL